MVAATSKPLITPTDRFGLTFSLAIMVHGILALGITFAPEDIPSPRYETMKITLVQQKSEPPEDAKILAQASFQGGGSESEEDSSTPAPAPFPQEEPEIVEPPPAEPQPPEESATDAPDIIVETEAQPTEILEEIAVESDEAEERLAEEVDAEDEEAKPAEEVAEQQKPEEKAQEKQVPEKPKLPPTPSAMALMVERRRQIASLSAQLEDRMKKLSERSKKKIITSTTKEYKYAAYMKVWENKVVRVGNLNYPAAAKKNKLSGCLTLAVEINKDGSINKIDVRRSSGHKILDDAAVHTVELAAPYPPFPDDFPEDSLIIVRTWKYSNNKGLNQSDGC